MRASPVRFGVTFPLFVAAVVAAPARSARASSSLELVGPVASSNALTARILSRSAAAAYFNPALLPTAAVGTEIGFAFLTTHADIDLERRPAGIDVADDVYDARFAGDSGRLRPFPTAELQPRSGTALRASTAYAAIGVVRPVLDPYLVFGFYGLMPIQSFHRQRSFFPDEREQYFSNRLDFELLGDRGEIASFAVALASAPADWAAFGVGLDVAIGTKATTAVYVPNAADQRRVLLNPDVEVDSVFAPYAGLVTRPSDHLALASTVHFPVSSDIEGENRIRFYNFVYPEGEDSVDQVFSSSTGYLPLRAAFGASWLSGGVDATGGWEVGGEVRLERWSQYRDRHGERPLDGWSDTVGVGVGGAHIFDERRLSADLRFAPSPVPDQTGRSSYVDSSRVMLSAGLEAPARLLGVGFALGGYLHAQWLLRRAVHKSPDASNPVFDEFPDGSTDLVTGDRLVAADGFQTNNPGYPGFSSGGWILGAGLSLRVPD